MSTPRSAPLAGKPPYATDEDDAIYDSQKPIPRPRKQKPEDPNSASARASAYGTYDHYFDGNRASGIGAVGMGLLNGDLDDSDDEKPTKSNNTQTAQRVPNQPAAAVSRPPPAAVAPLRVPPALQPQPVMREAPRRDGLKPAVDLRVAVPPNQASQATIVHGVPPREPAPAFMQPPPSPSPSYNPHPLGAPSTPITPIFARPSMDTQRRDVKFSSDAIMRGNSEETLLARSTTKGDEFWKRFSMVAKEDNNPKHKQSAWLTKTQGGKSRMSTCVWIISVVLLLAIGGAVGVGWYFTHNEPASLPVAVGGSANETKGSKAPAVAVSTSSLPAPTATSTRPAKRRLLGGWKELD